MVTKERLQIIVDLSPIPSNGIITKIEIGDRNVRITSLEYDENGNVYNSEWSMPVKSNKDDEHSLG